MTDPRPTGPTEHLETAEYWRELYSSAIAEGQENLAALVGLRAQRDALQANLELHKPGDPAWSAEFDRLQGVIAALGAQRDAALEALRGDEQAVWKVAYAHDILAAGVQPEGSGTE
jgi:hypothetical protein